MKSLNKKDYLRIYTNMLEIRRFEERAVQLFGMGHIGGFCHLYIGQEAVVIGVLMTIDKNDCVVTTYRDHGHMIARGLDPNNIMAELTGRSTGYSKFISPVSLFLNNRSSVSCGNALTISSKRSFVYGVESSPSIISLKSGRWTVLILLTPIV